MIRVVRALLIVLFTGLVASAQIPRVETARPISSPNVETVDFESKLMGRKMPFRVVLPASYSTRGEEGRRFPVLYLLHGLTGHFDNWTSRTSVVSYAAAYSLIIVTPEGENGWYTDHLVKEKQEYESYLIRELIPEIDKRYRTLDRRSHRAIAGLSMGGYGAIKLGLKYPEMFAIAGSFSGAIGATDVTERDFPGPTGRTIDEAFGPVDGVIRQANNPFDIVRRAGSDKIKSFPFLYVDCGTEDFLFQSNRDFIQLLVEKKVPHEYRHRPGAHNWQYWDAQVKEFLQVADRIINFK